MLDSRAANSLNPKAYDPLPLGTIKPQGWLLNQLRIQAAGLSGHLDEFWPDIAQSGWIGGSAEGWERGPYWLDGMVPLAFLLDDAALITKVHRWMDHILNQQHPDGWLGPLQSQDRRIYDPWPIFVLLKALTQYQEATGDARIIPAMEKVLHRLDALLDEQPLQDWSKSRAADLILSIYWLFQRTQAPWLLDLARKAHRQGLDWREHFAHFSYQEKQGPDSKFDHPTHGVNNAMGLKQPAVWWCLSHEPEDRQSSARFIKVLDTFHGQATGVFTCDEHYAGLDPSQGTETCTIVEYMFSLETLLSILGESQFGDRLERIAFNNLPAAFKSDMWAHQYDQQANQVICKVADKFVYTNNGGDANIFGLEPCYGCCTANMHQGWPKFAAHLWMKQGEGVLAAVAYAPSIVHTQLNGVPVEVELATEYPFQDELRFTVKANQPIRFALDLRIPAWTTHPELKVGDDNMVFPQPGTFHRLERQWSTRTNITLKLPMPVLIQRRYHGSASIERGPLVYVLQIGAEWKRIKGELPHADWEVYPITPWNYALALDIDHPEKSLHFHSEPLGSCPFSPDGAPVHATVQGKLLPSWSLENNAAGSLPISPVDAAEPMVDLTLIPYGCSHLRITEFPVLKHF